MESKLQELTDKIYNEGIAKARREAAEILEKANQEAEQVLTQARNEANRLLDEAARQSDEFRKNVENEMKMSARQAMSALKQQVATLVTARVAEAPVKEAFADKDFIRKTIETLVSNWSPQAGGGLALVLPAGDEKGLGAYFTSRAHSILTEGLTIEFDNRMGAGFRLGPADKSYVISFTEDDFGNFFKNYLRPRTTKLLYGGE